MLLGHMAIARHSRFKGGHTHPTDMRLAALTRYMVTALRLFDWSLAFGTVLDVEFLL